MSEFSALRESSNLLAETLRAAFIAEPQLNPLFAGTHRVSLKTPKEMSGGAPPEVGLSVWLYQVERNEFLSNRPLERLDLDELRLPPLPVNLHYLMTPITDDPRNEQLIMGKVLQVLHDHALVLPDPLNPELVDRLRVTLENPSLEVLARVWTALAEPYRLCTSYLVQAVNIRSGSQPYRGAPVVDKLLTYTQIVGET